MASTVVSAPLRETVDVKTIGEAFLRTSAERADDIAFRTRDGSIEWTWGDVREKVKALAGGLSKLGIGPGDTVAIMFNNRPEFHVADLAVLATGATPFSLYQTLAPNEIEYVVGDAGSKAAIVEGGFLKNFQAANTPTVEHLIVLDADEVPEGALAWDEVMGMNPDFDLEAAMKKITPDDLLTLIYTSGTTGPPKGVELTQRNLISVVQGIEDIVSLPDDAKVISWLPAAHIAERAAHHYLPIVFGFTVTTLDNPREIIATLPQVRPSWFFAVPRIWEKLKSGLESMLNGLPEEQRAKAQETLDAAIQKVRLEQEGKEVPADIAEKVAEADRTMFSGLRAQLGLDNVVAVHVGAAPTPREVLEFFHAIGIELAELWGMSETSANGTINRPGNIKLGTVGQVSPGVELKLADDGELLVRGQCVMRGYRNKPEKTAEAIDPEGWLHTGDIAEIDEDGFVKIVDRKKELIINAAGKNMSPANIEGELKGSSPLIGQAAAIGDRRPYVTALIVLDPDFAQAFAAKHGLEGKSLEELADEPLIREEVQKGVDAANKRLARVEQIKKFHIVKGDWVPGGDEVTPTMKLKRKPIAEKYKEEIEALYA
jgi:long-chain acyl-CoA synthetase